MLTKFTWGSGYWYDHRCAIHLPSVLENLEKQGLNPKILQENMPPNFRIYPPRHCLQCPDQKVKVNEISK